MHFLVNVISFYIRLNPSIVLELMQITKRRSRSCRLITVLMITRISSLFFISKPVCWQVMRCGRNDWLEWSDGSFTRRTRRSMWSNDWWRFYYKLLIVFISINQSVKNKRNKRPLSFPLVAGLRHFMKIQCLKERLENFFKMSFNRKALHSLAITSLITLTAIITVVQAFLSQSTRAENA